MVRSIAITGGVGAGKSTVAAVLREFGYPVLDADVLAREALFEPGVQAAVEAIFSESVFVERGVLDRDRVRKLVLANPSQRRELEGVIHPVVMRLFKARRLLLESLACDAWLFYEIPLLFESGRQGDFDAVVVVTAETSIRVERLRTTRGLSQSEAEAFVAAQFPEERKVAEADFVIHNNAFRNALGQATLQCLQSLREKFSLLDS
jgi:dephospho-CoA kinase